MESNKPLLLDIMRISDPRGNLAVLQHPSTLPFEPVRTYWIHDIPAGTEMPASANYRSQQLIIALSGSFEVEAEWAGGTKKFLLNRADKGLYLPPLTWYRIFNTSTNAVVFGVSSILYDSSDIVSDYDLFKNIVNDDNA